MEKNIIEQLKQHKKLAICMPRRHGKTRLLYNIAVDLDDPHLLVLVVSERSKLTYMGAEVMCMTYREQSANHQQSHIYLCDDADHSGTHLPNEGTIILTYSNHDWNPPSGFLLINLCGSI